MQQVGTGDCPYLIEYYGAMIDTVSKDSCEFCIIMFFLKVYSELCICMELMDTTLRRFYQTMHQLGNIDPNNLDFLVRRVIHNVKSTLVNFYSLILSLTQIASALHFLAEKQYLHRDIKPENILVNDRGVFKLNDYGTCCDMNLAQTDPIGTIAYFPPELVRNPPAPSSIQGDMWALGISVVETILGQHPCPLSNGIERFLILTEWNRDILESIIPDDVRALILQL
ncbi:unnamed protein product [Rotaria sp. Silwood2]|nr:unnamed protein product [Rotaria sp. Silwood2]CAF4088537.1 unnamed protein product [Rotaria sp. Silwood2]CAF4161903.1 unnamed protein product [Rotaria sp. Silwood2]CAF4197063.1 unnamed protein product [Rotaria sp. Silwood2]